MARRKIQIEDIPQQYMQNGGKSSGYSLYDRINNQSNIPNNDPGFYKPDPYAKYIDPRIPHEIDSLRNTPGQNDLMYRQGDPVRDRINYLQQLQEQQRTNGMKRDHVPIPLQYGGNAQNASHWGKKEFGGVLQKFMKNGGDVGKLQQFMQAGGDMSTLDNNTPNAYASVNNGIVTPTVDMNQQNPDPNADSRAQKYDNNITNASPDSPIGPGANPDYNAADESTNYTANSNNSGQGVQMKNQRRPIGQGYQNLLGAGMAAASFYEDQRNQRNMQGYNRKLGQSDTAFAAGKLNTAGNYGDYNQSGVFRPDANTPRFSGIQYPQAQMGGYQTGGVVELPDHEIQRLRSLGYRVDYV